MSDDFLRDHIIAASSRSEHETGRLTSLMFHACWPGGPGDRTEPAALEWVRRWRPSRAGAKLPACSCPDRRCSVCN